MGQTPAIVVNDVFRAAGRRTQFEKFVDLFLVFCDSDARQTLVGQSFQF
jgi:hypothetical protein